MISIDDTQKDGWSCNEINQNLWYLSENITNLTSILILLLESGIISEDERELIVSERTTLSRNNSLLVLIQRKNWPDRRAIFLQILRKTGNEHCANKIEQTRTGTLDFQTSDKLDSKWWPEAKFLPKAFHQRKSEDVLLIQKLKEMLSQDDSNGVAVITQKVTVSGLGGIGKTTTAIWFAQEYQSEYTHILWIDCGEGRLLNTFSKLAIDLKLQHRTEFDLEELALRCFKILADLKCLLIFDNAECYIGNDGVKKVLPKSIKCFDILITSRHQDWGNANGDGEIPQYLMNVFDQNEGVEFMMKNIKDLSEQQKSHIGQLCNLLGNHPLALQIAVATLNRQKSLNLENYINRIQNSSEVLHVGFDNYEKTIDKTMKISLDLIQNFESNGDKNVGALAYKIMTIFAFVTPDEVPADFFIAIETRQLTILKTITGWFTGINKSTPSISKLDIHAAINLLEKYSLLTRNGYVENEYALSDDQHTLSEDQYTSSEDQYTLSEDQYTISEDQYTLSEDQYTLSIHRLLQQVIRYNEKDAKQQIIQQILNCKGFLNYKLIPFTYADQRLQKKFKTVRAKLIDKLNLFQLLKEGRFTEAVELSRIIANVLKDQVSRYNYAVCLKHNFQYQQSEKELESLSKVMIANETQSFFPEYYSNFGIIIASGNVNQYLVRGQLLFIYLMNKNFARARKAAIQWKNLTLPFLPLNEIIAFINLMSLPNVFLQLLGKENCITFRVSDGSELTSSLELHSWVIHARTLHKEDIHQLTLVNCSILTSGTNLLTAKTITISNAKFGKNIIAHGTPSTNEFLTTEYFDFNKVEKLVLKQMQIDFCVKEIFSEADVTTKSMEVFKHDKEDWMMSHSLIHYIDSIQDYQTTLTEIIIEDSCVEISILPLSLKKLQLKNCQLVNNYQNYVKRQPVPNGLEHLSLVNIFVKREHGAPCTPFDVSYLISLTLKTLQIKGFPYKCSCLMISLSSLTFIEFLDLSECALIIVPHIHISPTQLTLANVRIINESKEIMSHAIVNQFVVFNEVKCLHLYGMSIDFNEPVQLSELTLINTKVMNWKQGRWVVGKVRTFPNLGLTRMKFNQIESVKEPRDDENSSDIEMKKEKLLQFFKNISGSKKTRLFSNAKPKNYIDKIECKAGVLTSILTTEIDSSLLNRLQTLIEDAISNWNNGCLVNINWHPDKLDDILKDGSETSWIDLLEEGGVRNKLWKNELDTYAYFLHQLQVVGVVPIISLLPEINYKNEFILWCGRSGSNGSLKLFQITKDYLTQQHGLISFIWAWSLYLDVEGDMTRLKDYWPGNNYADVVTVDRTVAWNRKKLSSREYQSLLDVAGDKPIAIRRKNDSFCFITHGANRVLQ